MFTKQYLIQQIREMGILPTDTVLIHTSLRAIGEVENGADGIIDAFTEYLNDGLFLVPTHTWATVNQPPHVYDVKTEIPCIGTLPRVAAFRTDGVRSLHPTHSMWGCGKNVAQFLQGEELLQTPADPKGAWGRLADVNAKILLIGVGLDKNTFIHSVEEMANIPDRLKSEAYDITIIDAEGRRITHPYHRHLCSRSRDVSQQYVNFERPLLYHNAMTFGRFGNAVVRIVDAKKCKDVLRNVFARADRDLCIAKTDIPEEFYT